MRRVRIFLIVTLIFLISQSELLMAGDFYRDYLLPDSSSRIIDQSEIAGWSAQKLCYARNEIYARLGRGFQSRELRDYFNSKDWYLELYSPENFPNELLNSCEYANVDMLYGREYELCPGGYVLDQPGYEIYGAAETKAAVNEFGNYSLSREAKRAYADVLENDSWLDSFAGPYWGSYFDFLNFDNDADQDLLIFGTRLEEHDQYHWKIYSYEENGGVILLAKDDGREVGNAGYSLSIGNGNYIRQKENKSLVGYDVICDSYDYWKDGNANKLYYCYYAEREFQENKGFSTTETYTYQLNGEDISSQEYEKCRKSIGAEEISEKALGIMDREDLVGFENKESVIQALREN